MKTLAYEPNDSLTPVPDQAAPAALSAFGSLAPLASDLASLEDRALQQIDSADPRITGQAQKIRTSLRDFEPGVTFIGQVKAGKTTLVNAMVGWPGLLPADVNPWTSVVTSLHLAPEGRHCPQRSAFRFFSNEEWENLIVQGGRIGEIASRAGAAEEMAKVRAQLDTLREKSRQRLGRRFEMLLGQTHSYDTVDAKLVKRYVSLGDDFWDAAGDRRVDGRFADITKTADLWIAGPDLPVGLCLQDTPGVNDTFMIREQITLRGLRGSRLCVVVLSAQQALSSVDLGLIRLISNVKARDVILFVNRIDELADPTQDVPRIRESIVATLAQLEGGQQAEIVFGSAYWAEHAVANRLDQLGEDSSAALLNWAESEINTVPDHAAPRDLIWQLSGVPALGAAIAERIVTGQAKQLIAKMETALGNLETGARVRHRAIGGQPAPGRAADLLPAAVAGSFDAIVRRAAGALDAKLSKATETFDQRSQNAHRTFLDRATGELVRHLQDRGDQDVWSYDAAGLRMLLRSAYKVFATTANKAAAEELAALATDISTLIKDEAAFDVSDLSILPPPVPPADAPVALAQTVALDLKGNWWSRFWRRRRGYQAFAEDFAKLIAQETANMPAQLRRDCVDVHGALLRKTLEDFAADQRALTFGQGPAPG